MLYGVAAVHSGVHVFGVVVEQFVIPAASNAYSFAPHDPT
jgi:hypothetical protein